MGGNKTASATAGGIGVAATTDNLLDGTTAHFPAFGAQDLPLEPVPVRQLMIAFEKWFRTLQLPIALKTKCGISSSSQFQISNFLNILFVELILKER